MLSFFLNILQDCVLFIFAMVSERGWWVISWCEFLGMLEYHRQKFWECGCSSNLVKSSLHWSIVVNQPIDAHVYPYCMAKIGILYP